MTELTRATLGDLERDYPPIRIGQFLLDECVGSGAMGEVWKGNHVEQGTDVAIKVILTEQALNERFERVFRQEVRSVASLSHPFVIDVIDYGAVDEETEDLSVGRLKAGSPFLAMEYAQYGSLQPVINESLRWGAVKLIVFSLLDSLAHSHARGMVHRDIKPQNVLLTETLNGWPGVRLTDYGLAYALWDSRHIPEWHRTAGTPEYMAPEQVMADWRNYGAATDLYGMGCLVYEMVTGVAPFGGNNIVQIAQAHLKNSMPKLDPWMEVPEGLGEWLGGLLAKKPNERFRTAAAAAHALRQICGPFDVYEMREEWEHLVKPHAGDGNKDSSPTLAASMMPTHTLDTLLREPGGDEESHQGVSRKLLSIPKSWTRRRRDGAPVRLAGTGKGLFGLRRLPILGRDKERDRLWSGLRRCAEKGRPQVVLLQGAAGVGKDYLAEWLCDRVVEVGAGRVIRVYHEDSPELVDGIARALSREFTLTGMSRPEVEDFFETLIKGLGATNRYEWESITEIISPMEPGDVGPRVHFASSTQRHLAVVHFFKRLTQEGPIVLWLNDVQWGSEVLSFVEVLLDQEAVDVPIFLVLTARDDLLVASEHHLGKVNSILAHKDTESHTLAPLDEPTMRKLVEEALFLEPEVAFEVAKRSGGNPLHALEMVREWVDRGLLYETREGYALREGEEVDLISKEMGQISTEMGQIWSGVVDRLVGDLEESRIILELGAILGERFPRRTWRRGAASIGLSLPEGLVERLLERKYIYETAVGLVFSQNLFREALLASARNNGRWEQLCAACAKVIEAEDDRGVGVDERLGFLHIESGNILEAARRLLKSCEWRRMRGEYHAIPYITSDAVKKLKQEPGVEAKRIWLRLTRWRSQAYHVLNENDSAFALAQTAWESAVELGDEKEIALCMIFRAQALHILGEIGEAKEQGEQALNVLKYEKEHENRFGCARVCILLGSIARRQNRLKDAHQWLERGREYSDSLADEVLACNLEYLGLTIQFIAGEKIVRGSVDALVERCKKTRTPVGLASALNLRAEVARRSGEFDLAEEDYRRSIETFYLVDPGRGTAPKMNLALVLLEKGEFVEAGLNAVRIVQSVRRKTRPMFRLYALAATLPMWVVRGEFDKLGQSTQEIEAVLQKLEIGADRDLFFCLKTALDQWTENEQGQEKLREKMEKLLAQVDSGA